MKFLWSKLEMIPHIVFPGWECPCIICLQLLYSFKIYIQNCVHIMFKIWYITMILYYLFSVLSTWSKVSFMRKCCRGTLITLRTENEENPELVISNVHKRTSAPDGPSFGSMYTTSLWQTLKEGKWVCLCVTAVIQGYSVQTIVSLHRSATH